MDPSRADTSESEAVLVGAHYFGGWYDCPAGTSASCQSHWAGFDTRGNPVADWRPIYPRRIPLLSNYSTLTEETVGAEIKAADGGLDFLDVLWYDRGAAAVHTVVPGCRNADPNLAHCLDTPLAWMLNSSTVWAGVRRLRFFVTFSNDVDAATGGRATFAGSQGRALWHSFVGTWVRAMAHPHYLRIDGRPVFKLLLQDTFVRQQCGNNSTLANELLQTLREVAVVAGVGLPLVGMGGQVPSIPASARAAPLPHPQGYMRYNRTDIFGSNLGSGMLVPAPEACQMACNHTQGCSAFTLAYSPTRMLLSEIDHAQNHASRWCQLKTATGPGVANASIDTFVRVPEPVQLDFTGTYCGVARVPGSRMQQYSVMAEAQTQALGNHTKDAVPYVPSLIAGLDPRPWKVRCRL